MAGNAKTNNFMLGTATVMIGPAADLYNLNPDDHSIGLVKNFSATSEPSYTELTQGVKGEIVHSILTANPVRCSMEAYEYTAKNLAYALGLEGAESFDAQSVTTTTTELTAASPAVSDVNVADSSAIQVGDHVMFIVPASGGEEDAVVRKVTAVGNSPDNITLDQPLPAMASGTTLHVVNAISVGSKDDQPFYAAKVAGKLADGSEIVILIPKLRIVKGFNLAFTTENYANMPIEFTVYDLVSTDTFYGDFDGSQARIYKK